MGEMKVMEKRRRRRLPLSRRAVDGQQEKPRKLQVRMRMKRSFLQRKPKVRAEDGLLARRPKKRSKTRTMRRKMVEMRKLQPRKPQVEGVHQAKLRKRPCTRRTAKKTAMEAIQSLRLSKTRGARMTLIQKLLQRRQRRLLQRRSQEERKDEGGHPDQELPRRRKTRVQSTTSMTSPT